MMAQRTRHEAAAGRRAEWRRFPWLVEDMRADDDASSERRDGHRAAPVPRPLVQQVDEAFRALHAAVEMFIDSAAQCYGINRNDQRCLELLDRRGPLTAGQLADAAGLSAAAVTKVVDRLLAVGYVERVRSDDDRRRVIIVTTPAERRIAREVFAPIVADGFQMLSELTDDELRLLHDVVRRATEVNTAHAERVRRSAPPARQ
jgi:DNA-binding MarR family transcriptional regulator